LSQNSDDISSIYAVASHKSSNPLRLLLSRITQTRSLYTQIQFPILSND